MIELLRTLLWWSLPFLTLIRSIPADSAVQESKSNVWSYSEDRRQLTYNRVALGCE